MHHKANTEMRRVCKIHRNLGLSYSRASAYVGNRRLLSSKTEDPRSENIGSTLSPLSLEDSQPVSQMEIKSFLKQQGLKYSEGYTCYKTTCAMHSIGTLRIAEIDKQFINAKTGYFVCESCNKSGPWHSYKQNIENLFQHYQDKKCLPEYCFQDTELPVDITSKQKSELKQAENVYNTSIPLKSLKEVEFINLQQDLGIQGLRMKTMERFNVRLIKSKNGIVIPLYGITGALVGVKVIHFIIYHVKNQPRKRVYHKTLPRLECHSLFGLNLIKPSDRNVTLTASELDAMAIYQETGYTVLALPKGQNILYQQLLPRLEQFNKITVWPDEDAQSWETAVGFTRKLNDKRCYLIRPSQEHPSAFKALQQKVSITYILKSERPVSHKSIVSFHDLRQEVFLELSQADKRAGVQWDRFPVMNKLLKGHRRGELTIFTGPTGAGKTTFISEYSLDLCMKGVNTLWGSFEINNVRLLKTMLTQYAKRNLVKNIEEYNVWADKFEQLPLHFMTFHGQENIKRVIETMSHAAYVYDVAHVIVDNLQFMMGTDPNKEDRFVRQDQLIAAFRKFSTTMNCHVTLVVHPRKEKEDELSVASIFGSAKASQEADNVLILQDKRLTSVRGRKYVQVAKNRFDGELGIMLLKFDKDALSYSLVHKKEKTSHEGISEPSETDPDRF